MADITQEELRKKFEYEYNTGIFISRKRSKVVGSSHGKGYITIYVNGKNYLAHRLAWIYAYGDIASGYQVDHINHNKKDNTIDNLRLVNNQENHKNKAYKGKVFGVNWYDPYNMWRARIMVDSKDISLGYFKTYSEAVDVRMMAEAFYGFHKNHGKEL